jgi:hypothetical protein
VPAIAGLPPAGKQCSDVRCEQIVLIRKSPEQTARRFRFDLAGKGGTASL